MIRWQSMMASLRLEMGVRTVKDKGCIRYDYLELDNVEL